MRSRVGVDLVPLARVRRMLDGGERTALERMVRPDELDECRREGLIDVSALAGRLAAKEAVFKLFLRGDTVLPWTLIRISAPERAWPEVELEGAARGYARDAGIDGPISVSITHDGDYAIAVAAAMSAPAEESPQRIA
ncbi:4'-phosphopantetheinyl transferase superfamily protein [Nocardiopsis sp. CNT-189]|uniref:holo-ACP synthase n=1 Tax=Nocardiopsis oceanisediminis TaxID=2816862 RepID=UPI003B368211